MADPDRSPKFKYQHIYRELKSLVEGGTYEAGEQLPTELELAERFGASRPTVTRALNALREDGLITRRSGAGSFVEASGAAYRQESRLFGLLIPGLGQGEIFEPICAQIAARAEENDFSLLWSGSGIRTEEAARVLVDVTQRYIDNRVAGVFFEPLELSPRFAEINQVLVGMLERAGIPVVLIDSDYLPFPEMSRYDLVGIDNFRAGYLVAQHYLHRGIQRVDFLARPYSAATVSLRVEGYRSALVDYGVAPHPEWVHFFNPEDRFTLRNEVLSSGAQHLICGNDETAAALMGELDEIGVSVPKDLRIVGFDDIRYASMLKTPLTTLHQPATEIGELALETMLWRLENPERPPRTVTAATAIIQRASCGAGFSDR